MMSLPEVDTILDWAQEAGMKTGMVSTARITHATPAALYAKTSYRDWECDTMMPAPAPMEARDIARQLVETERGQRTNVVLGGGRAAFTPADDATKNHDVNDVNEFRCGRRDGVDLVKQWKHNHSRGQFVSSKSELFKINPKKTEHVLGNFVDFLKQKDTASLTRS